jgi:hypothetical protein
MYRVSFVRRSISVRWFVLLASLVCLLSGCLSLGRAKETAEQSVKDFHSQLGSERYSDIYSHADEEFKRAVTQVELEKLLRAINQKLGTVQSANQTGYLTTFGAGTVVTLNYETTFARGLATEQFVYHVSGSRAALLNYTINSVDLLTN